ncbi:MAG: hypothetical protein IJF18_04135 [Oscillospiraceae bacterium]|nr:hypothetical protein [Oscillospiraceae bacterium]
MLNYNWIANLDNKGLTTPFKVKYDNEYFPALKMMLEDLVNRFRIAGMEDTFVEAIDAYQKEIVNSIEKYYCGDLVNAQLIINKIINEFLEPPAITGINDSIAFPNNGTEIQFFRARLSDNVIDFPANEMLHIPFKKRSIVKSERFSIPGLPCLYLGNSSYACWIEMGCPADHRFNVSPIVLDNTQKVLNLTVTLGDLYQFNEKELEWSKKQKDNYLLNILKLMILTFCTSYKVDEQNRNFKSEYIISQMIMLACKSRGLDGITYYSKQVSSEVFACTAGVNLVLFASYNGEEELSSICEHIKIGDSYNFSMFKQLLPSMTYKGYELSVMHTPYIRNIGSLKRQIPYNDTMFYEFDKYLFANWDK